MSGARVNGWAPPGASQLVSGPREVVWISKKMQSVLCPAQDRAAASVSSSREKREKERRALTKEIVHETDDPGTFAFVLFANQVGRSGH